MWDGNELIPVPQERLGPVLFLVSTPAQLTQHQQSVLRSKICELMDVDYPSHTTKSIRTTCMDELYLEIINYEGDIGVTDKLDQQGVVDCASQEIMKFDKNSVVVSGWLASEGKYARQVKAWCERHHIRHLTIPIDNV